MSSAPKGWTEEQARAVVKLGFTFPFARTSNGFGNAVAVRGTHRVSPLMSLTTDGPTMFEPWTTPWQQATAIRWAPGVTFDTPEAAIVWADIEGWGDGTNS